MKKILAFISISLVIAFSFLLPVLISKDSGDTPLVFMDVNPNGYNPSYSSFIMNGTYQPSSKIILETPYEGDMWYIPYTGSEYISLCRWDIFDANMKLVDTVEHEPSFNEKVDKIVDEDIEFFWGFSDTYEYTIPSTFLHKTGQWYAASYFVLNTGLIVGEQRYIEFTVEGNLFYDIIGNIFFEASLLDLCILVIFIIFIIYLLPSALARDRRPFFESLQSFLKKQKIMSPRKKITPRQQKLAIIGIAVIFALIIIMILVF